MSTVALATILSLLTSQHLDPPMYEFNPQLGFELATLSSYAYCGERSLLKHGFGVCRDEVYSLQAIMQEDADKITIAFRGSVDLNNWFTDLDSIKTQYYNQSYVHAGFYKAWDQMKSQILNATRGKAHVFVTGHSLGGALAQLAAVDISLQGANVTLVSFGSPRVGDQVFASIINKQVPHNFRVTHWRDPIVHAPLVLQGFIHAGVEVFYSDLEQYTACNSTVETIWCGANTVIPLPNVNQHLDYIIPAISTCRLDASVFLQ